MNSNYRPGLTPGLVTIVEEKIDWSKVFGQVFEVLKCTQVDN